VSDRTGQKVPEPSFRRSDGLIHRLPPNQEPTMLVEACRVTRMKMLAEYVENAIKFEKMAAEEKDAS
jgi:hypothetical protein